MHLLLVEGSPVIASGIANHLEALGIDDYTSVSSSAEALQCLQEQPVDLLITGWELTESSGLALTRHIRAHPEHQQLPVLMISPHDDRRRVLRAHQAGVDGYLLRPFMRNALAVKIEELAACAISISPDLL